MSEETSIKDWLAIIAMIALLIAGGVMGTLDSTLHHLREWLIGHQLLLAPGGGVVTIPHLGSLDVGRVVIVVALLVLVVSAGRLVFTRGRANRESS